MSTQIPDCPKCGRPPTLNLRAYSASCDWCGMTWSGDGLGWRADADPATRLEATITVRLARAGALIAGRSPSMQAAIDRAAEHEAQAARAEFYRAGCRAEASPRYVVKRGDEAVGMRGVDCGDGETAQGFACEVAAAWLDGDRPAASIVRVPPDAGRHWFVVDTHAPTQAPAPRWVEEPPPGAFITDGAAAPPTDAEIVAWMEETARIEEGPPEGVGWVIRGHRVSRVEAQAAWSRVLAAKVAASDAERTERARRVVLGPIDDAEVP